MDEEGAGKKILVVDDKEDSRILVKKVLGRRGYTIIEAGTGEDAVTAAKTEFPDLILMDIRLPGSIDGLEATKQIKSVPRLAKIPIIALTASVRPEDMHLALSQGCNGFIRKPIDINELPKQVSEYIASAATQ
ncbi:MAG: response regulator [Dehalococcoidales bacterium]|nr:response regulator [Dehalococcoidales bacterium]